jgi:hypothetical protein
MRVLVLVLCALAACSYPEKVMIDATGTPYGCLNAPPPTTAANPIVVSGTVDDAFTMTPVANAAVAGQLSGVTTPIFVDHTDASGKFRQSQATNGAPLSWFFHISDNGYIDTYYYPSRPLTHDVSYPSLLLLTSMDMATLASLAQITVNPGDSTALLTVNDCNGTPVAGATIATTPAGTIRYFNGVQPSTTATATDAGGVVMVANLPPGNVMLSATAGGMAFKAVNFESVAGAIIQTEIQP